MTTLPSQVTQLLIKWSEGDKAALDQLIPFVHSELRRIARRYMRRQNPGHTLETSALINEAYLRLVDQQSVEWKDRAHFFAVSAKIMRHILIDHARKYRYVKHGGHVRKIELNEAATMPAQRAAEFVVLHDALGELEAVDPRKSQIVELRFFGGLNIEETAEVMKISPATVQREWRAARAWLQRAMK